MKKRLKWIILASGAGFAALALVLLFTIRITVPPLQVGLLYADEPSQNIAQYFEQPLLYHMDFTLVNTADVQNFRNFDLLVIDGSVSNDLELAASLLSFVEAGGRIALTSETKGFLKLMGFNFNFAPYSPADGLFVAGHDPRLNGIGQIFYDYIHYFVGFQDYGYLRHRTAGYALSLPMGVNPIVYTADQAGVLAASITAGAGEIFYFGALLPDNFFITSFDFLPRAGELPYFNNTASAAEHLLWNELASVVSLEVHGFSLWRVFGLHGRPAMAHQNHSEVLTALAQGHMEIWANIAQEHGQIASFSLAYGLYDWFYRYESFGYSLGNPDGSFQNNRTRNFYAWGRQIASQGRWLNLAQGDYFGSFFTDPPEATRSFPAVIDLDGDGVLSLVSGSSDGHFHLFSTVGFEPRWTVEPVGVLPFNVGSFSAPTFGEGMMVSGSGHGNLYVWQWFGGLNFSDEPVVINPPAGETLSAPDIVDFNGNGTLDIIAGFASGNIYLFDGTNNFEATLLFASGERNAAPRAIDLTRDGTFDLVVGNHSGDILRFYNDAGGTFTHGGWMLEQAQAGAINFKNTPGINTGNNVTPLFVDLNGDGVLDLVWGLLEYGRMSVALLDDFFPYYYELAQALQAMREMHVPITLHNYTHVFASLEDEREMLLAEIYALQALGITAPMGINQHTWATSGLGHAQTLHLQAELGFLWNSGHRPSGSPSDPATSTEYGMITPFFFTGRCGNQMFLYNANYLNDNFIASARYNLPVTIYMHTWSQAINNPNALHDFALRTRAFQQAHMYNFVTEEQLFKSIAATFETEIKVQRRLIDIVADLARGFIGQTSRMDLYLSIIIPQNASPLFDEVFAHSIGLRVVLGEQGRPYLDTSALVRHNNEQGFHISLSGGQSVHIWTRHDNLLPETYLVAVNLPASISQTNNEISINFYDSGLQQVFIRSERPITSSSADFEIEQIEDGLYRLSYTGYQTSLTIVLEAQ